MFGSVEVIESSDDSCKFEGVIPESLELFEDHFPGFPILPGVLALEIMKESLQEIRIEKTLRLHSIERVKFSSYLKPGESWRSEAKLKFENNDTKVWKVKLLSGDRVASSAEFHYFLPN